MSPSATIGDSRLSAITAWSFLTHGNFDLERYRTVTSLAARPDLIGRGGHLLPFFPWPTMLFALPGDIVWWLLGHNPARLSIANPSHTFLIEIPTASLMVALTGLALRAAIIRSRAHFYSSRVATLTAVLFAFTTSAWSIGSRALWQQTASMLWLSVLLLLIVQLSSGAKCFARIGLVGGLAVICRPTDLVIVAVTLGWVVLRYRRAAWATVLTASSVAGVFLVISRVSYGIWLPDYYSFGRFNGKVAIGFFDGLFYNTVSPSRGLLIYDPILLLAAAGVVVLWRRQEITPAVTIAALSFPIQLLVIADYGSDGGTAYGPRLMIDVVPLLAFLAAPVVAMALDRTCNRRALSLGLVITVSTFGLFVNATGALLRSSRCWNDVPVNFDSKPSRAWSWSDAQFLWPYRQIADGGSFHDVETPVCTLSG